jgi:integrase
MARTPRAASLETRTARLRLKPRRRPYCAPSGKRGVQIGYRRTVAGNGSWVAKRYTGRMASGGQYETEVFAEADDYSDADGSSILDYFQAMARLGTDLSEVQRRTRYTVRNAVDDYIAQLNLHAKTGKETAGALKHYVLGFLDADRPLSELTRDDFAKWPAWAIAHPPPGRRKKAREIRTYSPDETAEIQRKRKERVNRVLNNVLACLNKAHEDDHVPSDAAWSKLKRFRGTKQSRKRWLDVDEARRLTNACEPDFRKIVQAGLLTGCRWSELRRLQASDYDAASGTLLVATGKGGKKRHVYLTDEGRAAFSDWTAGLGRSAAMLTRANGEPWGSHDQHRPMHMAVQAARLETRVTFHGLRHTYASMLVKLGVSLAVVAEALGHQDTRMVSEHYGHLAPSHVAESIRANLPSFGVEIGGKVARLRP